MTASLFVKQYIRDGILVEVLAPGFKIFNPKLYNQLIMGGGAMAVKLASASITHPDVIRKDVEIVMAEDIVARLTPEEFTAIVEHELAHILNGDLDDERAVGKKYHVVDLYEQRADAAAVAKVGAAVTLSAILKVERYTTMAMLRTNSETIANIFNAIFRGRVGRKRIRVLKAIAREAEPINL